MENKSVRKNIWSEYDFTKIPFSELVRVGQRSLLNKDLFCVSWLLGRYCNYNCSYCWPYGRSDQRDHRSTELLLSTMDEIKRQARERGFNSFHFSFSGGEPTTHKGLLKVLQHYVSDQKRANYQSVHMTTNLSPGKGWWKKFVKSTKDLDRVSLTASHHIEFAKAKDFRDKLLFLQDHRVRVTINMVMCPDLFSESMEKALYFHDAGINVTLKPQSNKTATKIVEGYTEEQLGLLKKGMPQRDYVRPKLGQPENGDVRTAIGSDGVPSVLQVELTDSEGKAWFLDQAERFNAFEFNQFMGWECSSGFRSIIIREPDGLVKRSYSCQEEPLGHIETGFKLFSNPTPCKTQSCVSSADSKIPKRKKGVKLPLWPGDRTFELNEQ